jgi:DNA modification methylase
MTVRIVQGHALDALRGMEAESVQCCVTSPPYWGLRDYGTEPMVWGGDPVCPHRWGDEVMAGEGYSSGNKRKWQHGASREADPSNWEGKTSQGVPCSLCGAWRGHLGLEPTPELYVAHIVEIFREVWKVLRKDGTLWLNLGDCYAAAGYSRQDNTGGAKRLDGGKQKHTSVPPGLKPKDLVGVPWRVAFALQADSWWLRSDIVWSKPNPMPESVTDRPTRAHEYIFLMTKSARYFYDADAIKEGLAESSIQRISQPNFENQTGGPKDYGPESNRSSRKSLENLKKRHDKKRGHVREHSGFIDSWDGKSKKEQVSDGRNKRTVWTVATQPFPDAHFATFPPKLIEPCILAGCPEGGLVLDPFGGSGTVGLVADRLGREAVLIELNPEYCEMAKRRIESDAPLFAEVEAP